MTIEKINFIYPNTQPSVYDTESKTVLQLAAKTSAKVDECVELVNGVSQIAAEATAIVDDMATTQADFVAETTDSHNQVVSANQTFIDGMNADKTAFEGSLNTSKTTFETNMNTALSTFETGLNSSKATFESNMTAAVNTINTNATTTIENKVNTDLNTMKTDGTIADILSDTFTPITDAINTEIDTMTAKLPLAAQSKILTVGSKGCMFTTINAAIDYAKTYCTTTNRVLIQIAPDTYNEQIKLLPNPGIDFRGSGLQNTFVTSALAYPDSPLYTVGTGHFEGITFSSTGTNSYAFHFESQDNAATGSITIINCKFTATLHAGAGIGMGNNTSITFKGCEFESFASDKPAFYCHNLPTAAANQFLYVLNCSIVSQTGYTPVVIENARAIASNTGTSNMYVSFAGTYSRTPKVRYTKAAATTINYVPKSGDDIVLLDNSLGTNIMGLDYDKSYITQTGFYYANSYRSATVFFQDATKYDWTLVSANNEAGTDILSLTTLSSPTNGYILATTTDTGSANKSLNLTLRGIPK